MDSSSLDAPTSTTNNGNQTVKMEAKVGEDITIDSTSTVTTITTVGTTTSSTLEQDINIHIHTSYTINDNNYKQTRTTMEVTS